MRPEFDRSIGLGSIWHEHGYPRRPGDRLVGPEAALPSGGPQPLAAVWRLRPRPDPVWHRDRRTFPELRAPRPAPVPLAGGRFPSAARRHSATPDPAPHTPPR